MESSTIRMKDVLYVPDLDINFLSISALNRNGLGVFFWTGGVEIEQDTTLVASGILRREMYLLHTSQTALLGADAGNTSSNSDFLNGTVLTLGAAKQSTSHPGEAEITERLEAKNANRVVESPDRSLDFGTNILATSENAIRLALYWLWNARMGHNNPKRLRSLSQRVNRLEQVNSPSFERFNFAKYNFSNMTQIVNRNAPKRILQRIRKVHTDIWGPYQVSSIGGNTYFLSSIDDWPRSLGCFVWNLGRSFTRRSMNSRRPLVLNWKKKLQSSAVKIPENMRNLWV